MTETQPRALIVSGGWPGHKPQQLAQIVTRMLEESGLHVTAADTLDVLDDVTELPGYRLIVPNWTMGTISASQSSHLRAAIRGGVGLGGFHGGMGDAFRSDTEYQFMTGGQFVAHPGNIRDYRVDIHDTAHPITQGLSGFDMRSEQYYMHVDPSNSVLVTTTFDGEHAPWIAGTVMPLAWVRRYGEGNVFYSSIGHDPAEFEHPTVYTLHQRGLLWAAGSLT
jgi:type 1 glutamine amidotransferase